MVNEANGATNEEKSKTGRKAKEKSTGRRVRSRKSIRWKIPVAIWVAVIGSITTIAVALINSPPSPPEPTPTNTPISTSSAVAVITDALPPLPTETSKLAITASPTSTPTMTVTPTETPTTQPSPAPLFIVNLIADKTTGRRPLIVKFDARDSIMHEPNGAQLSCRTGPCNYTWRVYSGGLQLGKSENNTSGRFEYVFRERGTYIVTVYICRGQDKVDCGSSTTWIEVTR